MPLNNHTAVRLQEMEIKFASKKAGNTSRTVTVRVDTVDSQRTLITFTEPKPLVGRGRFLSPVYMRLLCDYYVIAMWLLCDYYVITMYACDYYVITM